MKVRQNESAAAKPKWVSSETKMSAHDIPSSFDVLATYPHPIDNFVIHVIKDKYRVMMMTAEERPTRNVCDAIDVCILAIKNDISVGETNFFGKGTTWKLTVLRISQTQFLVKFRPGIAMD